VQSSLLVVTLLATWVCVLAGVGAVVCGLELLLTGSEMDVRLFLTGTVAALAYVVARLANAARHKGEASNENGVPP
jgi:hypothetical protein